MAERTDIYLSRADVEALARYAFPLPVTHGFSQDYVRRTYPGWEWNDLLPVLQATGQYDRDTRTLRPDLVGVLFTADGDTIDDDGSLTHPAKPVVLRVVPDTEQP